MPSQTCAAGEHCHSSLHFHTVIKGLNINLAIRKSAVNGKRVAFASPQHSVHRQVEELGRRNSSTELPSKAVLNGRRDQPVKELGAVKSSIPSESLY